MKTLIIAEKPSQAKSLMEAFEPNAQKKQGYYEGNNFIITNAIGHLFGRALDTFAEKWNDDYEQLPKTFDASNNQIKYYKVKSQTKPQLMIIKSLLDRTDIKEIVCGTDPDAEGETIYREIIEFYKKEKMPQKRLMIKDTTVPGLKKQWEVMKDIKEYEGLRQRAYARSLFDFTVGINLTRAVNVAAGTSGVSVGRVVSPLLKLVVDRYTQNKGFKEIINFGLVFKFLDVELTNSKHRFDTVEQAKNYISSLPKEFQTTVAKKEISKKAPSLYDLAGIQKVANDKFSYTAEETLELVQKLYEQKLVSYPRTDCTNITNETAEYLNKIYGGKKIGDISLNSSINKQCLGETTAHEGITLTSEVATSLSTKEANIYQEIYNVFISNFLPDAIYDEYEVTIKTEEFAYTQKFNVLKKAGYLDFYDNKPVKFVDSFDPSKYDKKNLSYDISSKEIKSKPKKLFTASTLLSKMDNIHSDINNKELEELSKEIKGIGTPATRGAIIQKLFDTKVVELKGKNFIPTEKGINAIKILEDLKLPIIDLDYTAKMEQSLRDVEKHKNIEEFITTINKETSIMIENIRKANITKAPSSFGGAKEVIGKCPKCGKDIFENDKSFYCSGYKDEPKCNFSFWKETKFFENKIKVTKSKMQQLLKGEATFKLKGKDAKSYEQKMEIKENGKYFNLVKK